MIDTLSYIISNSLNPYYNLALENYLFDHVKESECILYLWQNERTVVIGKNQNPYKECKIAEIEKDGGTFVRRLSGGGAVFHDIGNLNFTFITKKNNYDVEKQLEVILQAVNFYGIHAKKTGRNDITVDGKKISGNAFYENNGNCYHHGTLLVHVDMSKLSHYLNVSKDKLAGNGVESVRARVTNLMDYNQDITIEDLKEKLLVSLQKVYGQIGQPYVEPERLLLEQYEIQFSSDEFRYGKRIESNYTIQHKFPWGMVTMDFLIRKDKIEDCVIYTDALDTNIGCKTEELLINCKFSSDHIRNRYYQWLASDEEACSMRMDLMEYILREVENDGL